MRRLLSISLAATAGLCLVSGCRTSASKPLGPPLAAAQVAPALPAEIEPLPAVADAGSGAVEVAPSRTHVAPVVLTGHEQPDRLPALTASSTSEPPALETVPAGEPSGATMVMERFPIDMPTALQLAGQGNHQVAFARERISQAWARAEAAKVLWLPSLRAGVGYNRHEGQIQDIQGQVFAVGRSNVWSGLGAAVPGAASPAVPGIYANFHLADAWFEPLAARQAAAARQHAAAAVTNDVLWRVSLAYLELARATEEMAIADATVSENRELVRLTVAYAEAGQGEEADADRAQTELALRENDRLRADEARRVASARLAELVRLNAETCLEAIDPLTVPVELFPPEACLGDLVAQGLSTRPELGEHRHLVSQAVQKMRREQYAVLMPSVVLGLSYGGFGGGTGPFVGNYSNRMDADAIAYWQVRHLGLGERAARAEAASVVRQANVQHVAMLDQVAREIVEAHAQVESRRGQIAIARRAVEMASHSHDRNLDRIQNGKGLPIEVLQANQALNQARRDYLRALADYNAAQFTLYRAVGSP